MAIEKENLDAMYNLIQLYKNELQNDETANFYFEMHKKYTNEEKRE